MESNALAKSQREAKTLKGKRVLTLSSSKPNVPRLLPMPLEADVENGAPDGSGVSLSLILSKNDMVGGRGGLKGVLEGSEAERGKV
jgi:hypothetical protein